MNKKSFIIFKSGSVKGHFGVLKNKCDKLINKYISDKFNNKTHVRKKKFMKFANTFMIRAPLTLRRPH